MKIAITIAAGLVLSGCSQTLSDFFGTDDPCQQAAAFHAGFTTVAAIEPKVARLEKHERTVYAAVREQCADGDATKVTLTKVLNVYAAAITEWKKGNEVDAEKVKKVIKDAG
jgi:hypothetical protein